MKGVEMSVSKMTHWERVTAAVAGEAVDRVPFSLWRHFPESDRDPARLAEACVAWQRMHDFDRAAPTGSKIGARRAPMSARRSAPGR